jgi:deoxyribonucleoside regulator
MAYSRKEMIKIAKLYYEENYTQNDIASLLNISRQTVGRILNDAQKKGIVQIRVIDENEEYYQYLKNFLKDRYNLIDVVIKPVYDAGLDSIHHALGEAGSDYLINKLEEGQTLGISWGRTLLEVVKSIRQLSKKVDVVQLNGALEQVYLEFNSNELASIMAGKLQGNHYYLHAPGIVDTEKIRDSLLEDRSIKYSLDKARNANIAALGIGSVENSPLYSLGCIGEKDILEIKKKGGVGDLCLRIIDRNGNPVDTDLDRRVIGLSLDDLKNIDCVIGIAGGEKKVDVIIGALKGHYLDVLITDSITADLLHDLS